MSRKVTSPREQQGQSFDGSKIANGGGLRVEGGYVACNVMESLTL